MWLADCSRALVELELGKEFMRDGRQEEIAVINTIRDNGIDQDLCAVPNTGRA